jgi:adenine-specific DNA-methyltransferase
MLENNGYQNWSKKELVEEIRKLKKRKKYGVVWEEKPEEVAELCKEKLPILVEEKDKEIKKSKDSPVNILIDGENYHALSVLNYTHRGKVDVIYIDPPYNTGTGDGFKYNNFYVDVEDSFRHSKWLSFMEKRLKLAKNLLKKDGVIIVTIDDYEVFTLGLLMDEIFGESNRIGILIIETNPRGRTTNKFFATCHEYALFYAKSASVIDIKNLPLTEEQIANFKFEDEISKYRLLPFRRSGGLSTPDERPNSYYPIYYNEEKNKLSIEKKTGYIEILPIDSKGKKRVWRQTRPSLIKAIERGDMVVKKMKKGYTILMKDRIKEGRKPKTIWINPKYDASSNGTVLLEKILGRSKTFSYPKSLYAVQDTLNVIIRDKKEALVLDFFAGSGTTGHAVMEINKNDEGKRKFILCTNNENNICTKVCYPRIKKVNEGNLKYFKTAFVDAKSTDINKKKLVDKSTEMLCLREDCFNEINKGRDFRIFKDNQGKYLGIIYSDDGIGAFKKELKKLNKKFIIYVFSLDESAREEEFEDVKKLVDLKPIPAVILNVYKRIFK